MFPGHENPPYPSRFIEVHAKEDPRHSIAIKKTVRKIEPELSGVKRRRLSGSRARAGSFC